MTQPFPPLRREPPDRELLALPPPDLERPELLERPLAAELRLEPLERVADDRFDDPLLPLLVRVDGCDCPGRDRVLGGVLDRV